MLINKKTKRSEKICYSLKATAVLAGITVGALPRGNALPTELINTGINMADRKYIIESRRYIGEDGKTTSDSWIASSNVIEIKHADQYLVFYPLEGEHAGKKHNIPFSNIHVVREL
jgi:hypothetical protein